MGDEVRALGICYKLLSRMSGNAQAASIEWLVARLEADRFASNEIKAGLSRRERKEVSVAVGDAALSMVSLLHATGANSGRRTVEVRGPLNANVTVCVKKLANT